MAHPAEAYNSDPSLHQQELANISDARVLLSSPQQSSSQVCQRTRRERLDRRSQRLRSDFHDELHQQLQQCQRYEGIRQARQCHINDDEEKKSDSSVPSERIKEKNEIGGEHQLDYSDLTRQPQHLLTPEVSHANEDGNIRYYRIVYRGVVALLSQPAYGSPRSGCYLSYGEVIKSACKIPMNHQNSEDKPQGEMAAIRVDEVLTGGYACDPPDPCNINFSTEGHSKTPRRSNVHSYQATAAVSSETLSPSANLHSFASVEDDIGERLALCNDTIDAGRCEHNGVNHQGFIFSHSKKTNTPILELLVEPPQFEHGRFFYKVLSTTPLPIISGPRSDAPLTKAMVLPGTVHEVSLRMKFSGETDEQTWFLRLARRKGYLSSHHKTTRQQQHRGMKSSELLVKDITEVIHESALERHSSCGEDGSHVSALSALSTTISSSIARCANQRHRPPRRQRQTEERPIHQHGISAFTARTSAHNLSHHQNNNHLNDSTLTNLVQSHSSERLQTPSSNVSFLSDDSCLLVDQHTSFGSNHENNQPHNPRGALSPDRSVARCTKGNPSFQQPQLHLTFYLMRVTAPRGMRILDAPHFQVNNLIHGPQQAQQQSQDISGFQGSKGHQHHVFQTMAGRIATSNPSENNVIFDSVTKTRILPRGAVFEASKRMETSDALFHQGAGLIKLADNSGWVIVPHKEELEHQYRSSNEGGAVRAYEEIGNAIVFADVKTDVWIRVVARAGAHIVCAPPPPQLHNDDSLSSSPVSPPASPNTSGDQLDVSKSDSASDVASSVGSSFLDAMLRLPRRPETSDRGNAADKTKDTVNAEKQLLNSNTIPCGICVKVEPQIPSEHHRSAQQEFARLRGGQGWLPLFAGGKPTCIVCPRANPPSSRFGSFWFRVQSKRGIKVRLGPSTRAPSIKSSDGVYFRFECGEFLRASEVMTVYYDDRHGRTLSESFAKLYRNRHVRLNDAAQGEGDFRRLIGLTAPAEWVQIHDDDKNEQFLQECTTGSPRIERHKLGWRYKAITSTGIAIRKGPSFDAEVADLYVANEESVVISERVTSPEEDGVTWLRLKEGQGWLHDIDRETREKVLIPHTFRHRTVATNMRPSKARRPEGQQVDKHQQIAYNTIIARLFHNDLPHGHNLG